MLERRISLLNEKIALLRTKKDMLIKMNRLEEANQVSNEIYKALEKLGMLTSKKYQRTVNQFNKAVDKNNATLNRIVTKINNNEMDTPLSQISHSRK